VLLSFVIALSVGLISAAKEDGARTSGAEEVVADLPLEDAKIDVDAPPKKKNSSPARYVELFAPPGCKRKNFPDILRFIDEEVPKHKYLPIREYSWVIAPYFVFYDEDDIVVEKSYLRESTFEDMKRILREKGIRTMEQDAKGKKTKAKKKSE